MIKKCEICKKEFQSYKGTAKTCSPICKKQKKIEYDRGHYQKNKDDIQEQHKIYYKKHKKAHSMRRRKYYLTNRIRLLEWHKKYRQEPRNKLKDKNRNIVRYSIHKKEWQDRDKKYRFGEIITPSVIKAEKKLSFIKKMYAKRNYDTKSIAKKIGVTQNTIFAVLRKNNIPIKPKAFHNQKLLPCSNGLLVRSNGERIIVEYLIAKRINFEYELPIKYGHKTYHPDFYIAEKDLYVEFAGLFNVAWYKEQLEKKKRAYKELNMNAIFITKPEQICEVII